MRRERRGRAKAREASQANPRRARFSTGAARRKQGEERGGPRVSKGGPERRSIATRIADERRKSDRLMSGRERRAAKPPRSVSKMQSAVTNGADSRAHLLLDAAISAGLAPEGNLTIAERG